MLEHWQHNTGISCKVREATLPRSLRYPPEFTITTIVKSIFARQQCENNSIASERHICYFRKGGNYKLKQKIPLFGLCSVPLPRAVLILPIVFGVNPSKYSNLQKITAWQMQWLGANIGQRIHPGFLSTLWDLKVNKVSGESKPRKICACVWESISLQTGDIVLKTCSWQNIKYQIKIGAA